MSDQVTVKISGLKEMQAIFEQLPKRVADQVIRKDLLAAGDLAKKEIVARAPVIEHPTTGAPAHFVAEHFTIQTHVSKIDIAASVKVGPARGVDFPDSEGKYRTKTGKNGKTQDVGRISVASVVRFLEFGSVDRAGKPKKKIPFMSQSWEAVKQRCLDLIISGLRESLKRYGLK